MKLRLNRLLLALPLLATACASANHGLMQTINVQTISDGGMVQGAQCFVGNGVSATYIQTPTLVTVRRTYGNLNISCQAAGYNSNSVLTPASPSAWFWGNFGLGGVVGLATDLGDGAAWRYPNSITVPLMPETNPGT